MSAVPERQVWILRHAKAAPHSSDDHARPLTGRGRRQCAELAAHLLDSGLADALPGTVLVSSAERARQTAELVLEPLGDVARIDVRVELYRADADDVLGLLRGLPDDEPSAMVVGHNPTLEHLAWLLVGDDRAGRAALDDGLSTGALAVVDLGPSPWPAVGAGSGRLHSLYSPKAR